MRLQAELHGINHDRHGEAGDPSAIILILMKIALLAGGEDREYSADATLACYQMISMWI